MLVYVGTQCIRSNLTKIIIPVRNYEKCSLHTKEVESYEIRIRKTISKFMYTANSSQIVTATPLARHESTSNTANLEKHYATSTKVPDVHFKVPQIPSRNFFPKSRRYSLSQNAIPIDKQEKSSKYAVLQYTKKIENIENTKHIYTTKNETILADNPSLYRFNLTENKNTLPSHEDKNIKFDKQYNYNRKMNYFNPWLVSVYNSTNQQLNSKPGSFVPVNQYLNKPNKPYQNHLQILKPLSKKIRNSGHKMQRKIYKVPIIPIQNKILIKKSHSAPKRNVELPYYLNKFYNRQNNCFCKDCENFVRQNVSESCLQSRQISGKKGTFETSVCNEQDKKKSRKSTPKKIMKKKAVGVNLDMNYLITFNAPISSDVVESKGKHISVKNEKKSNLSDGKIVAIDCDGNLVTHKEVTTEEDTKQIDSNKTNVDPSKGKSATSRTEYNNGSYESVDKRHCQEMLITYNIQENRTYWHLQNDYNKDQSNTNLDNLKDEQLFGQSNSPEIDIVTVDEDDADFQRTKKNFSKTLTFAIE